MMELKISAAQFPQQRCESEPAVLKVIPPSLLKGISVRQNLKKKNDEI